MTLDFRCALAGKTNLQNCSPRSRGTGEPAEPKEMTILLHWLPLANVIK